MNLLLLNWQDPANPKAGGAEVHLLEIFRRLRRRGHQVTWLASGWRGAPSVEEIDGIEVHRTAGRYTFGPAAVAYYRRVLVQRRFGLVVEALNKVPLYAPAWCGRPSALIVHHLFGTTAFREAPLPVAGLTWLMERPLRAVYGKVPVVAISRSTAEDLIRRGLPADQVRVVNPGVDVDFFHPSPSPTRAVIPTFLYLGRLQRYKRIDLILRAFARLRADGRPSRLIIAGRGDQEPRLRKLAAKLQVDKSVDFAGFVTEERKRDLFRLAWANLLVSSKEGWGISNLEAAACGTPTIASDSPGLRDSVLPGRTGVLVPHGDIATLSVAMRRFACTPGLVEELGAAALEFARSLTWERAAAAVEDHLASAVGNGPSHGSSQQPSSR